MNKVSVIGKRFAILASLAGLFMTQSCSKGPTDGGGDLIGVEGRESWVQTVPYGMVVCPSGTFHMGQADQDVPATQINLNKQVTIGGFYMDETEITNNEYRQFMNVMLEDSVATLGEDKRKFRSLLLF